MWMTYENSENWTEVPIVAIVEVDRQYNITDYDYDLRIRTLTVTLENGKHIRFRPLLTDDQEWRTMLKLARISVDVGGI